MRFYSIERMPSGEVYGAQCCDKGNDGAFKLTRIYYHHKGTPEFRKTIFYIHGMVTEFDDVPFVAIRLHIFRLPEIRIANNKGIIG